MKMKNLSRVRWLLAAATTAAAGATLAATLLVVEPGCSSDCASECPPTSVYIGNLDNRQLFIDDITAEGPACPPREGLYCLGDGLTTSCTHVTITGQAEGICDVTIWFNDRPAEIVRTQFGGPVQKGCCKGRSIIGDTVFEIPTASDAGITDSDGGRDAVRPVDAGGSATGDGAAGDGGTGDGSASDGATD